MRYIDMLASLERHTRLVEGRQPVRTAPESASMALQAFIRRDIVDHFLSRYGESIGTEADQHLAGFVAFLGMTTYARASKRLIVLADPRFGTNLPFDEPYFPNGSPSSIMTISGESRLRKLVKGVGRYDHVLMIAQASDLSISIKSAAEAVARRAPAYTIIGNSNLLAAPSEHDGTAFQLMPRRNLSVFVGDRI
jgi:hypothetical protein